MMKLRRMKWSRYTAYMGGRTMMHKGYRKERVHEQDKQVDGRILLGWILERMDGVAQTAVVWRGIVSSEGL
jgi:hypothetical protein